MRIPVRDVPTRLATGANIADVDPGRVTFNLDVGEHLYNPIGSVHGGVFSTLLDSAMGCALGQRLVKCLTVDCRRSLPKDSQRGTLRARTRTSEP
jgi:uncharacterized protein (TIGR00369 family)